MSPAGPTLHADSFHSGQPGCCGGRGRLTSREQQGRRGMRLRLRASRHPRALSSGVAGSQPSVFRSASSGCATAAVCATSYWAANETYFSYSPGSREPRTSRNHPQNTHARAGGRCEMLFAAAAPIVEEKSVARVDLVYIIMPCLCPLLPNITPQAWAHSEDYPTPALAHFWCEATNKSGKRMCRTTQSQLGRVKRMSER